MARGCWVLVPLFALAALAACGGKATNPSTQVTPSGSSSGSSSGSPGVIMDAAAPAPTFGAPSLVTGGASITAVSMISDGTNLFLLGGWTSEPSSLGSGSGIWSVPVSGGEPVQIASNAWLESSPSGNLGSSAFLGQDASNVYFVSPDPPGSSVPWDKLGIASVPKARGQVTILFPVSSLVTVGFGAGTVTWVESDAPASEDGGPTALTVKSAPLTAGASPTVVGTVPASASTSSIGTNYGPDSVVTVGSTTFVSGPGFNAGALGADGAWNPLEGWSAAGVPGCSMMYLLADTTGVFTFGRVPNQPLIHWAPNGTTTILASPANGEPIVWAATDASNVYWIATSDGASAQVAGVARAGGTPFMVDTSTLDGGSPAWGPLAVDDAALYWFTFSSPDAAVSSNVTGIYDLVRVPKQP